MENQNVLSKGSILHERFAVKKVIGVGGFGITYLGEDTLLESRVAIKEYMPEGYLRAALPKKDSDSDSLFREGLEDFLEEAKLLSRCQELDGIVSVRDFFRENGTAYLVMDYISGTSVKERVRIQGKVDPDEVLEQMKPVIFSLAKLHKIGYIHRDISSDNLLYTSQNRLKLIDFGSARKMNPDGDSTRTIMFKRGYAAEEQYRAKGQQGAWTDIYGICAVLYFMMTGVTPAEAVERVIRDEVVLLEKQPQIELDLSRKKAIDKGMSVFAKDRFQSVEELYEELYMESIATDLDMEKSSEDAGQVDPTDASVFDEKTEVTAQASQAAFLATRTEFMKKTRDHYKEKHQEQLRKRKKRMLAGVILLLSLLGILFIVLWNVPKNHLQLGQRGEPKTASSGNGSGDDVVPAVVSPAVTLTPEVTEIPPATEVPRDSEQAPSVADSERVTVPNVVHFKKAKAIREIQEQALKYDISYRYSGVTKGKVISQSVEGGIVVKKGKRISLVVSKGKKPVSDFPANTKKPDVAERSAKNKNSKATTKPKVAGDITDLFGSE